MCDKQRGEPRVDRGLGADQVVQVHLGDHDLLVDRALHAPGDHELQAALPAPDALGPDLFPDLALLVDHAVQIHLGEDVDHARAADADGLRVADDAEVHLVRFRVDLDLFDGPFHGAHAELDAAPLEGGARRARRGHEPVLVPEHDLAVRADVDEERDLRPACGSATRARRR